MSALCLYVCGLMVSTPLQKLAPPACRGCQKLIEVAKKIRLTTSHPPDQNTETAPGIVFILCLLEASNKI